MKMNAVGIDVSKEKSTVAILRPFGEVVAAPYDVSHTDSELDRLAKVIKKLPGETRVVMEATGVYYEPVARRLHEHGIFVSVVNPVLISDYGDNTLRKAKTDKKDAVKIASYALNAWLDLVEYKPEEDHRRSLKSLNRQVKKVIKVNTMLKNNLPPSEAEKHGYERVNKYPKEAFLKKSICRVLFRLQFCVSV